MDALSLLSNACTPPLQPIRTIAPPSASFNNRAALFPWRKNSLLTLTSRRCHLRSVSVKCGGITEISEKEFGKKVLESDRPVLVEFVATWCGPCRLISPAIESIAQEYNDKLIVVKIDHDANPQLIEEYKVYGLPTLILFKNGQEVPESRREGAITKAKLKEYVDGLLEQVSAA